MYTKTSNQNIWVENNYNDIYIRLYFAHGTTIQTGDTAKPWGTTNPWEMSQPLAAPADISPHEWLELYEKTDCCMVFMVFTASLSVEEVTTASEFLIGVINKTYYDHLPKCVKC